MANRSTVKITGYADLERTMRALVEATSGQTGRNVIRRSMIQAAQPILETARALAPVRSGRLRDSIIISSRAKHEAGSAAYADAKRSGASNAEAVGALRDAQRDDPGRGTVRLFIGPSVRAPHAHLVEFGTFVAAPHPFMRPAFEQHKIGVLENLQVVLGSELIRTARRVSRSAQRASGAFDTRGSKG